MITYKYKLYHNDRNKVLQATLAEACCVWNHCLALQKRYYSLYGKYIKRFTLVKHMTKVWHRQYLGSQSLQEVVERLDKSYTRFFKHTSKRPPKFKRRSDFASFVYKQCGYKFEDNRVTLTLGKERITFKFSKSRDFQGTVKTVAVKRNHLNEYFLVIVTDACPQAIVKSHNGACVGIDFGLKTYLTMSDGTKLENPRFLQHSLNEVKKASRKLSRCKKGSNHREQARLAYCRLQQHLVNKRTDFQWKLAHELCKQYDFIFLEDLSLQGMTKLWGRKMSDLAHYSFTQILGQAALKYGVTVHKIDRFYASSRLCECGFKNDSLTLRDRQWVCPRCGQVYDRDVLAANNIPEGHFRIGE